MSGPLRIDRLTFPRLLLALRDAWATRREEVEQQGMQLTRAMSPLAGLRPSTEVVTDELLTQAYDALKSSFEYM